MHKSIYEIGKRVTTNFKKNVPRVSRGAMRRKNNLALNPNPSGKIALTKGSKAELYQ